MNEVVVKVINHSSHPLPAYETEQAAGMDLRANLSESVTIAAGKRELVPTGLSIELPVGYEAQVRPRSGLALKFGVTVLNSPGTIDADYRGEIKVLLVNHGEQDFTVNNGDRIAQLVVSAHAKACFQVAESLTATARGEGGYGSTGHTR
ncbi:MAG: dUTP diphosphatase [Bacteroidota bacterium]|jgi:dUTP pyrophosphatase